MEYLRSIGTVRIFSSLSSCTYMYSLLGKSLAFVTNNATKSRPVYLSKFEELGFTSTKLEEIFTCGSASASYLKNHVLPSLPEGRRGIYVIGQEGLESELREEGLIWKGGSVSFSHFEVFESKRVHSEEAAESNA